MCTRWLRGDRQETEEVLSRGSLRAIEFLRSHTVVVQRFRPWILRILRNLCSDTMRVTGRRADTSDDVHDESLVIPCRDALPDRVVYREQLRGAIAGAVARLPPRLATAFFLRFVDDLDYDAMCRRLAITPDNARKRVQQVRARLRGQLAPTT